MRILKSLVVAALAAASTLGLVALSAPAYACPLCGGTRLNSPVLNGIQLNGPVFQGPLLQGPVLNGPIFQGAALGTPSSIAATGARIGQPVAVTLADGTMVPVR